MAYKNPSKTKPPKAGEDEVPTENTIFEKPVAPRKIKDKTGWELRPENEMIMKGKKPTQTSPEGLKD